MRTLTLAVLLVGLHAHADLPADVWKAKCESCHGETGAADTKQGLKEKIPDMRTPAWQAEWTDEKIRDAITYGLPDKNKKMKPFKDKLSAEEITEQVKFIRGLRSGVALIQETVIAPALAPIAVAPTPTASPAVVFNTGREHPTRLEPRNLEALTVVPRPTTAEPNPVAPPPAAVQPAPALDDGLVKVGVKITPGEPAAEEPKAMPNSWLAIAAIGLSVVALIVALRRKR